MTQIQLLHQDLKQQETVLNYNLYLITRPLSNYYKEAHNNKTTLLS